MAEFFFEYGLFLAKTVTLVAAFIAIVLVTVMVAGRRQPQGRENIQIKKLNQKYSDIAMAVNSSILPKSEIKKLAKQEKQKQKARTAEEPRKRIFVLNFHGDIRASAVVSLREEITAILLVANERDEVFVRLESVGGIVNAYGLAASQLTRIRERNIPLTVAVDKVAASGGYMMACVANKIIAAPFSILGSIGVVAQIPNFNRLLKKHDIDFEQFTAGEFKRTITVFGENTEEGRTKFREEVEDIHLLFKDFIAKNRPQVDIVKVSTGEHWPGIRALENQLIDELKTSDDYLVERSKDADLFELKYTTRKPFMERLGFQMQRLYDQWRYG